MIIIRVPGPSPPVGDSRARHRPGATGKSLGRGTRRSQFQGAICSCKPLKFDVPCENHIAIEE